MKANDRTYHKQFKKKGFLCWRQKKYKVNRPLAAPGLALLLPGAPAPCLTPAGARVGGEGATLRVLELFFEMRSH